MAEQPGRAPLVNATVVEVLPGLGLAYLEGDDQRTWAVTKSTRGSGLSRLAPGKRVSLTVQHHREFSLVSAYAELD